MLEETPDSEKFVTIDFFGTDIQVPRNQYKTGEQFARISLDTVQLHSILKAQRNLQELYLPDKFKKLLTKAILFTAGEQRKIQSALHTFIHFFLRQRLPTLSFN